MGKVNMKRHVRSERHRTRERAPCAANPDPLQPPFFDAASAGSLVNLDPDGTVNLVKLPGPVRVRFERQHSIRLVHNRQHSPPCGDRTQSAKSMIFGLNPGTSSVRYL